MLNISYSIIKDGNSIAKDGYYSIIKESAFACEDNNALLLHSEPQKRFSITNTSTKLGQSFVIEIVLKLQFYSNKIWTPTGHLS
jgi:hypothetical protein